MRVNGKDYRQQVTWCGFLDSLIDGAQLAIHISMIKKLFRGFGYIFLVVPGLDFMLTVKSSQKLSLPSVPNFKNEGFYSENEIFSALFDIST